MAGRENTQGVIERRVNKYIKVIRGKNRCSKSQTTMVCR